MAERYHLHIPDEKTEEELVEAFKDKKNLRDEVRVLKRLDKQKRKQYVKLQENLQQIFQIVAKIETDLSPSQLLQILKSIETSVGRVPPPVRFGPRILDLDIVFYDDVVVEQDDLRVPHPRMHERRFVLQPFCDIDPDVVHPLIGQNIKELLAQLDDTQQPIEEIPCDFSSLSR